MVVSKKIGDDSAQKVIQGSYALAYALQSVDVNRLHLAKAVCDRKIRMIMLFVDCFITFQQRTDDVSSHTKKKDCASRR